MIGKNNITSHAPYLWYIMQQSPHQLSVVSVGAQQVMTGHVVIKVRLVPLTQQVWVHGQTRAEPPILTLVKRREVRLIPAWLLVCLVVREYKLNHYK